MVVVIVTVEKALTPKPRGRRHIVEIGDRTSRYNTVAGTIRTGVFLSAEIVWTLDGHNHLGTTQRRGYKVSYIDF